MLVDDGWCESLFVIGQTNHVCVGKYNNKKNRERIPGVSVIVESQCKGMDGLNDKEMLPGLRGRW